MQKPQDIAVSTPCRGQLALLVNRDADIENLP